MNTKKIRKYKAKRKQIINLLSQLKIDRLYDHNTIDYKNNGFNNEMEIAERILRRVGINKPIIDDE